jgi:hypothetical protein
METTVKKYSLHSGHHHPLRTQPLLSEVFMYALCPRQLSRVIAVTGVCLIDTDLLRFSTS